jgi:dTDP-4-dehydrorhamnose 3,5-epimerase
MSNLDIRRTKLDNVLVIKPPTIFEDFRGTYIETYNEHIYNDAGITAKFVQDDISVSSRHVLRGIHGDTKTWKLVSCLYGRFYLVVVNCDRQSTDFGKWDSFSLSDANRLQVLVPPKHGAAHLVMSDKAIFHYKQSTYYDRASQFTYKWNEPAFNIYWPVKNPILSERDARADELSRIATKRLS